MTKSASNCAVACSTVASATCCSFYPRTLVLRLPLYEVRYARSGANTFKTHSIAPTIWPKGIFPTKLQVCAGETNPCCYNTLLDYC